MSRRRKRQYFVGGLLFALLLVNAMFFGIVFYKAQSDYAALLNQIKEGEAEKTRKQARVNELIKTQDVLDSFPPDRMEFLSRHLVTRETGFARIIPILDDIARTAGVKKTRVEYSPPTPLPQYGLHKVSIRLPVQGDYESVRQFIKQLQNSKTVFIITAIDVHGATTSEDVEEEVSDVSLTLAMETYFYDERS